MGAGRRSRGGPGKCLGSRGPGRSRGCQSRRKPRRGMIPGDRRAAAGREVDLNIPTRRFTKVCQEGTCWSRSGTGIDDPAKLVKRVGGACSTDLTFLE